MVLSVHFAHLLGSQHHPQYGNKAARTPGLHQGGRMMGKPIPNPNAREGGKPASTFPPITARTLSRLSGDRGFFGGRRAAPTSPACGRLDPRS
jgi:hypothetical protein